MRHRVLIFVTASAFIAGGAPIASATSDVHRGYPALPSGYTGIVRTFGQPCDSDASRNATTWRASDDGERYPIRYHARLGGSFSTNLHDVVYHLSRGHDDEIRSGIYAYACRRKRGDDSEWSVHAWGIAIDVSTRFEHFRHAHCHVISSGAGGHWTDHRWRWGRAWSDCMHFQYASDY